jgi:hemolysin activation/secretion protein
MMLPVSGVYAQIVPDAGRLLQEQPKPPAVKPAPVPSLAPTAPPARKAPTGPSFLLKGIRFSGATLVPDADLQSRVSPFVGETINFAVLESLASQLTGYYLEKGYLARVVVPAQDVKDGIVEMKVVEGVRGDLKIDRKGERVDEGRVAAFIDHRLVKGDLFNVFALDAAISILNDQPGVQAQSSLQQGAKEAETDVLVLVADKPLWSGDAGINNYGSRASGEIQAQGSLTLNNPTGNFDAATLLVNLSEGVTYGRADYSLAVGNSGLRVGANASSLDYTLVQSNFAALDLNGNARTYGIYASYPLARTPAHSLYLTAGQDIKKLVDLVGSLETGNREVRTTSLGISGTLLHLLGSLNTQTSFGASLNFGESDERNAAALAVDSATRGVNGGFTKLAFGLGNQGEFNSRWNYSVALRGQFANHNLDSSERISLGGVTGIRAYPSGEALGDEGWLLNVNLRRSLGDSARATFFYDAGGVRLNKTTWANWNAANPGLENSYTLSGVGASLDWFLKRRAVLSAVVATPVTSKPGRDANGNNADGKNERMRVWISLNAQF